MIAHGTSSDCCHCCHCRPCRWCRTAAGRVVQGLDARPAQPPLPALVLRRPCRKHSLLPHLRSRRFYAAVSAADMTETSVGLRSTRPPARLAATRSRPTQQHGARPSLSTRRAVSAEKRLNGAMLFPVSFVRCSLTKAAVVAGGAWQDNNLPAGVACAHLAPVGHTKKVSDFPRKWSSQPSASGGGGGGGGGRHQKVREDIILFEQREGRPQRGQQ